MALTFLNNGYFENDLGIGVLNPASRLHVSGGSAIETTLTIGASGTGNDKSSRVFLNEGEAGVTDSKKYGFSLAYDGQGSQYGGLSANEFGILRHDNSSSGTAVMVMNRTDDNVSFPGKVGIGQNIPSYKLDVDGVIRATGNIFAFSDARVKENVVTIHNALDKVTRLRGVTYIRKDIEDKDIRIGVIAQEVLEVVPEVVNKDDNGMYSVAYGDMNGLLIEAIKELKAEIEELKSRL